MNSWAIFTLAFAAVVIQAWVRGRGSSNWYLGCIVPLVYGGAVAWMFVGKRDEEGEEIEGEPKEQEN